MPQIRLHNGWFSGSQPSENLISHPNALDRRSWQDASEIEQRTHIPLLPVRLAVEIGPVKQLRENLTTGQDLCSMKGKTVLGFTVLTFLIAGYSEADRKVQNTPPRKLAAENASEGLFPGMNHLFTIPNYWDYGNFKPQECVELPGKLFRATAHGQQCRQVFLISGHEKWSSDQPRISLSTGRLYAAWRVKDPNQVTSGGRYSCVHPGSSTWQVWLERRNPDLAVWHIQDKEWQDA